MRLLKSIIKVSKLFVVLVEGGLYVSTVIPALCCWWQTQGLFTFSRSTRWQPYLSLRWWQAKELIFWQGMKSQLDATSISLHPPALLNGRQMKKRVDASWCWSALRLARTECKASNLTDTYSFSISTFQLTPGQRIAFTSDSQFETPRLIV